MSSSVEVYPDISFSGCGFIGIYHVGVSACLHTHAPHLLKQRILGSSAGAIAGAALVGGVPLELMAQAVLQVSQLASGKVLRSFCPSFNLPAILWDSLAKLLPDDIHLLATDRLYVSMTKISDRSNLLVHKFSSKKELLEAVTASSFVPFMSGWKPPRFRGDLVFDGGYSDNLPVFDAHTITVSPFAGDASICPEDDTPLAALLNVKIPHGPSNTNNSFTLTRDNSVKIFNAVVPPNAEGMEKLCSQGYQDAMRFLVNHRYLKCGECRQSPREGCDECEAILENTETQTLPRQLKDVFEATKATASGVMASFFHSILAQK